MIVCNYDTTSMRLGTPKASDTEEKPSDNKFIITADLNDKELTKKIYEAALKQLSDEIKKSVKEILYKKRYGYYTGSETRSDLQDWIVDAIKEEVHENRDLIVEMAAAKLADSMRRSKPIRDKFGDLLEEELNGR